MMFMSLGIGLFLLPILFRLALKLRLGIPMLYAVLMLTAFHGWYQAHTSLADGIFFVPIALAALSWVVTLLCRLWDLLGAGGMSGPWETCWPIASGRPGPLASTISTPRASGDRYLSPISSRISLSLILMQPTRTSILKIPSPTSFHTIVAARVSSAMAGGVEAKTKKITQAKTMIQPSRQMAA